MNDVTQLKSSMTCTVTKKNYAIMKFLKNILREVQLVNKKFEAEVQDPTKLLGDYIHLIDSVSYKVLIPGRKLKNGDLLENYMEDNVADCI